MEWIVGGIVVVLALTIAVVFIRLSDLEYWVDAHMQEHKGTGPHAVE